MQWVSKIFCEKKLPIPFESFSEEEEKMFNNLKWDEQEFFTSSFIDYIEEPDISSSYTITEDDQLYRSLTRIKFEQNEKNEIIPIEKDEGIEKQEFTGELLFGTAILGEKYDYEMSFTALYFKGDLKELERTDWKKTDNEERKRRLEITENKIKEYAKKQNKKQNIFASLFRWTVNKIIYFIKWILFTIFKIITKIEIWTSK
tara:strand:- start:98 stop:703 length:606 start_codon:yes stop_codon:yes gene_type:complete